MPTGISTPRLTVPSGGLVGDYCWVFRSGTESLLPGGGVRRIAVSMAPTAAHAVARAWRQADLDAKAATNPASVLYSCETGRLLCLDGLDDDGDGVSDCADPDCAAHCSDAESSAAACSNALDDDGDEFSDCGDPGCAVHCEQSQVECRNGGDDDLDGSADCNDPDCGWLCALRADPCQSTGTDCGGAKRTPQSSCTTAADGGPDCSNRACAWECGIEWPDECGNGRDDDADGLTDLADPDCPGPEDSALRCADDLDNECEDPATGAPCAAPVAPDCEDPSCEAHCP
ncbi:MAG: hypothetical protein JNK45_36865 [Myxococcales bacterium]|nr:hypothetical protein [Myxococcales bacterium]